MSLTTSGLIAFDPSCPPPSRASICSAGDELAETKRALEERKIIDRAKGLLMKARGIGEDEAYAILRKTAMDKGKKISEVAGALVTAADLLS